MNYLDDYKNISSNKLLFPIEQNFGSKQEQFIYFLCLLNNKNDLINFLNQDNLNFKYLNIKLFLNSIFLLHDKKDSLDILNKYIKNFDENDLILFLNQINQFTNINTNNNLKFSDIYLFNDDNEKKFPKNTYRSNKSNYILLNDYSLYNEIITIIINSLEKKLKLFSFLDDKIEIKNFGKIFSYDINIWNNFNNFEKNEILKYSNKLAINIQKFYELPCNQIKQKLNNKKEIINSIILTNIDKPYIIKDCNIFFKNKYNDLLETHFFNIKIKWYNNKTLFNDFNLEHIRKNNFMYNIFQQKDPNIIIHSVSNYIYIKNKNYNFEENMKKTLDTIKTFCLKFQFEIKTEIFENIIFNEILNHNSNFKKSNVKNKI